MENIQISHVDGELPIYREMKPVPVTLENCILNNEEDYLYSQNVQPLEARHDYVNEELSAEDIKSMIMINEGPKVLSSVQEELESNKSNLTIQNNSDIKRILTSDLPKTGRFLSTKSLQKLSGAKNVIKKNPKYANEEETDVDDAFEAKVKKKVVKDKKIRNEKDSSGKIKSGKVFKNKIEKRSKKTKKGDFKEKFLIKQKDSSLLPKSLKRKAFKRGRLSQEKEENGSDTELSNANLQTEESSFKVLISRSGRMRKIKNVTKDFVIANKKEAKILIPDTENEIIHCEPEKIDESESINLGKSSKDVPKRNKEDLLQNVLSESVESWFDIAEVVEKKRKRGRTRIKINPKEPDTEIKNFELTEECGKKSLGQAEPNLSQDETEEPKAVDLNSETESTGSEINSVEATKCVPVSPVEFQEENENKADSKKGVENTITNEDLSEVKEEKTTTEVISKMQDEKESSEAKEEKENDENSSIDVTKSEVPVKEESLQTREEKVTITVAKKNKSAKRQIMSYKKKRRKRDVASYIKNYGEKINFVFKPDSEMEEKKPRNIEKLKPESGDSLSVRTLNVNLEKMPDSEKLKSQPENPRDDASLSEKSESNEEAKSDLKSKDANAVEGSGDVSNISNQQSISEPSENPEKVDESKMDMVTTSETPASLAPQEKRELTEVNVSENKSDEIEKSNTEKDSKGTESKKSGHLKTIVRKRPGRGKMRLSISKNFIKHKNFHMTVLGMKKAILNKAKMKKQNEGVCNENETSEQPAEDVKIDLKIEIVENKENEEIKNETKLSEVKEATADELSIPLKKRASRGRTVEALNEVKDVKLEAVEPGQQQKSERRKSHREIKLTPKIVDMIATSTCYKRTRKISSSKDESAATKTEPKERVIANSIKVEEKVKLEENLSQSLPVQTSMENYLQSKMEANASNFESQWSPGDLVWARFAGNPFWPSLILRDPFSNNEYSTIKYLGRLPRPFVHVQFLADYGRRAWGPELYIMNFEGLEKFETMKANLPEVNAFTNRKDLIYQRAFFTPKKLEKHWLQAVKEAEALLTKSNDERITYMNIKYPLVRYGESVANGRLVLNERIKAQKRKSSGLEASHEVGAHDSSLGKDGSLNAEDEETKGSDLDSPKLTLKLMRSPKKGSKRRLSRAVDEASEKKYKKKRNRKDDAEEEYAPSDSGSIGEKGSELVVKKKYNLFKGARTERVCQICFEILVNEKTLKCKGPCLGLFHKSCADKMNADLPPLEEGSKPGIKKRRKKLFCDEDINNSSTASADTEKDWRCCDCLRGENPCFICKSRSGNRQRCCVGPCGKFYHQKCLKLYPHTSYNQGAPLKKSQLQQQNKAEAESPHYQILSCPLHVCHTCASDNPIDFNVKHLGEKLVKCVKCPSAYHGGNYCVPAGSVILNTTQIICVKHEDPDVRSHVNISWCFICNMGGSLICCEWCPSSFHLDCLNIKPPEGPYICEECDSGRFPLFGEIVWVKLGRFRWWPARILYPQEIQPNIMALPHKSWEFVVRFYGSNDHYWLNRGRVFLYQEGDSEQKLRSQRHVDKVYLKAVQDAGKEYAALKEERKFRFMESNNSSSIKPPPYVKIKTNKAVGKVQLGNLSQSEPQTCDCDPNLEAPCKPGSDCLNRMLLVECNPNHCNAGPRCRNQSFEKREYPPLEAYKTENRGWGLKSLVDIAEGSFVIEYVGEVVDYEEFKRRMKRKLETKDSNYYFLTIDKDRMIDAGPKGNLARFMNHSCSPNCETQKWTVNGDTRVGLFALRDIPAGTELTFNYNLDCIGNEKKVCNCEQENCSGFIGVKAKNDKSDNVKAKAKRSEKESEDECFICHDGGELMVCDVPNCPKVYHLECVKLTEWPNEIWFCPRHSCCICKRTTKRCCKYCPTAYCFTHLDNNMFSDNQGGILCGEHSVYAVKPSQTLRKASYVNRSNSPAVEYEKPFAEKYRPPKGRTTPKEKKEEILMEPNLTDNTPIVVENPLLSPSVTPNRLNDGVSVEVFYVDEEGEIVSVDTTCSPSAVENVTSQSQETAKPPKRKKRTNIPRKKLNPPTNLGETENKQKQPTEGGINFESLMIKSVEDKILDSKLNMDNIYNIIGGGGDEESESGQTENGSSVKCIGDDLKAETVNKKEDAEVDRSRRSKYFKIITPEKFIKVQAEGEANQKKVTDFNYIEFMHPLRSARSKTKNDEKPRK